MYRPQKPWTNFDANSECFGDQPSRAGGRLSWQPLSLLYSAGQERECELTGRGRSQNKHEQKRFQSRKQRLKCLPPTCCSSKLGTAELLSHTTPCPLLPCWILPFLPHISTERAPASLTSPPVPEARPTRTAPAQVESGSAGPIQPHHLAQNLGSGYFRH